MRKKLCSKILALFLALNFIIPAFAAGDTALSAPEIELGAPAENLVEDQTPEEEQIPDDTQEPDENPDGEQTPEDPAEAETPETPADPAETETPEIPADPAETETPEIPADPAEPVTPAMPEGPATPPDEVSAPVSQPETAIIDVVVPDTGNIVINPYGLPVMLDDRETTEQIAGNTMLLENRSAVAVDVSASAVGTAFGDVVFVTTPPAPDAETKELFLYAEFQAIPDLVKDVPWTGVFSDASNQLLVKPYSESKDGLMRLDAAGMDYSWGAVRLFGSVAAYPDLPWQTGDGFEVNIVFTFTPVEDADPYTRS